MAQKVKKLEEILSLKGEAVKVVSYAAKHAAGGVSNIIDAIFSIV